jgi:hypothetical protein
MPDQSPCAEPDYPKAGCTQAELEDWIEAEIQRRVARAIEDAEQRLELSARKMADGTNDSRTIYECKGVWVIKVFVSNLIEVLNTAGAKNCLEMSIKPANDFHPVRVIIVRPRGKSPMEMMAELRRQVAEVRTMVAEKRYREAMDECVRLSESKDEGSIPGEDQP